uniref:Heat shock protein HSP70-binding protein 1 n=1 Tax=Spodoptera frugiperda TaxID=7108 RepID=A0A5Q0TZJ3_SPOFR|nr:heat shock protein HSP70-binding protein 1 [Spodoptera frugiperda]
MSSNHPNGITFPSPAASQASGMVPAPAMLTYPTDNHEVAGGVLSSSNLHSDPLSPQDSSSRGSAQNKRPPRNLQGLLKFAMEATQAEDAPGNKDLAPMDEQRRKFLEEAIKSLTVNIAEVLDNSIKVLTNSEKINSIQEGDSLPDEVKNSFTVLLDHVDDLDVANDFFKMGGFAMFPICYGSQNEELRTRASSVLGTICQNNEFCQKRALECGLLHVLLNLVQKEQGAALAKCLYAISCMSRGYEPACHELITQGGCPVLVELLSSSDLAAKTKAAFLIRYFGQYYADARRQLIRHNIVKVITSQLQAGRDESSEHLLSILQVLISSKDPNTLRLCRDPKYNLKKILEDYLNLPELRDDRFVEEKQYCTEILGTVFGNRSPVEEPAR